MPRQVCRYAQEPERFLALIERADCEHLDTTSFALNAQYYREYFAPASEQPYHDASFVIHDNDVPFVIVSGQAFNGMMLDNGRGVRIHIARPDIPAAEIIDAMDQVARGCGCEGYKVLEMPIGGGSATRVGQQLLLGGASCRVSMQANADLTPAVEQIKAGLRRRFRTYVNWGAANMTMEVVDAASFSQEKFDSFQAFHLRIAGRTTRPQSTWDIMAETVRAGRSELIVGYLAGHGMVSAAYFIDHGRTTTYGVGVFERSLFDKPISHCVMYQGMQRAKQRGQTVFQVGEVPARNEVDEKGFDIGYFKSGFVPQLTPAIEWTRRFSRN